MRCKGSQNSFHQCFISWLTSLEDLRYDDTFYNHLKPFTVTITKCRKLCYIFYKINMPSSLVSVNLVRSTYVGLEAVKTAAKKTVFCYKLLSLLLKL